MRQILRPLCPVILAAVFAAPLPLAAEAPKGDGRDLMERGLELFFDGLRGEMDPVLKDLEAFIAGAGPALQSFVEEMGPALRKLMEDVQDWSVYEPPVVLPNGDILIRRKPEPHSYDGGKVSPQGEVEL